MEVLQGPIERVQTSSPLRPAMFPVDKLGQELLAGTRVGSVPRDDGALTGTFQQFYRRSCTARR